MKRRYPKFRLRFRPKEDRREEYEPGKVVFLFKETTFWEVVVGAIKGAAYLVMFGVALYALAWLVFLLPLLF